MRSSPLWRWARIGSGIVLLILGVIGLFVPVLQGVVMIVMGLTLLSQDSVYAKQVLEWIRRRLPERHRGAAGTPAAEKTPKENRSDA